MHVLTHWPLGNVNVILDNQFSSLYQVIDGWGIFNDIALR